MPSVEARHAADWRALRDRVHADWDAREIRSAIIWAAARRETPATTPSRTRTGTNGAKRSGTP